MNINKRKRINDNEEEEDDSVDMIKRRKLNNDNIRITSLNNDFDKMNSLYGCIYENCHIKTNKRICKYHREREQHLKKTQNKLCSYNNDDDKKCFNKIYSSKTMLCSKHYKIFTNTNKIQHDSSYHCLFKECMNKKYKKNDYCRRHFYDLKQLKVYFFLKTNHFN